MDNLTIINYQGSKKNLLKFIHESLDQYITDADVILDIFSGTASVAYSYKATNTVYANDAEEYASVMAKALLESAGKYFGKDNYCGCDKRQRESDRFYPYFLYNRYREEVPSC